MDALLGRRTRRDQAGIDLVILGQLQVKLRIGPHLRRLKHHHREAVAAKMRHDIHLVAAAGLDPNPLYAMLTQPGRKPPVALRAVLDLKLFTTLV